MNNRECIPSPQPSSYQGEGAIVLLKKLYVYGKQSWYPLHVFFIEKAWYSGIVALLLAGIQ
ncbi:MAG: hypothetical protein A3H59_03455 [Candidatus Jacksonbacteria bacterium RIFCSPLOWO2_02_FULL_43_9]|nr:MAG: hypothetical protein A3B94_01775 [Candidatus Jacksonbacteria bacterium RIFCSPHIGHO2_02_FULL_43_10]OGY73712.1 MAG: hypothetical protein A3H59_03455 [Candidatus Jacksonbacteria bacterium RIFCSPLOWO2_02_FULL_43_9]HAZ16588.1 hypothetical protein [Candidatus Jacksonbacteria bacterium]